MLRDILLGVVQGLTEFLPVSSSGHLVIASELVDREPSLTYDLLLHVGTAVAVIVAMWRDLWALVTGALGRGPEPARARRLVGLIALASVPAAIAGLVLEDQFEELFERPGWVCVFWVVVGAWMWVAEDVAARRTRAPAATWTTGSATAMGVAQAAAIVPGISRSGATIAAGLVAGRRRDVATRFSFLMSVPIILGAALARIPDARDESFDVTAGVVAGTITAGVVGYLAIRWLLRFVQTHTLRPFSIYLFVAAPAFAILLALGD